MKKILLIGKTGQLASELIKDAINFDFEIISFSQAEADVTNESQITKLVNEIKVDVLINTSAYHVVPKCEDNPSDALAVNFIAVRNLARICKERNIVFVTYSTDYVFDGEKGSAYLENDNPNPLQIYGLSKLAGEDAALSVYSEGTLVIRTSGVYGGKNGSSQKGGNFVLNIMQEASSKDCLEVSCELFSSPTYSGNLSLATLKLLKTEAPAGRYHLVNEGFCSWYEFAVEIFKLAKINKEIKSVDRSGVSGKMRRPRFSALQNIKAKAFEIELPIWQEGLREYFKFLNEL